MEVIISAAVLVIVVMGVLAAVDAVTSTAGANKARTVAAALAENDQEQLRTLRTTELASLKTMIPAPRDVVVDRIHYTVTSDAEWVTDALGKNISCALSSGEGSFLRIKSTVSSPNRAIKPVVLTSIVAPQPGSGILTAIVKNAKGQPVTDLNVEAAGPKTTTTKKTDSSGCAVFGAVDSGAYEMRLDSAGWIGTDGNQRSLKNATVAAGSLTTVEMLYDRAATLTVTVDTKKSGASSAVTDDASGVMAAHNGLQTGFETFPDTNAADTNYTSFTLKLFPFTTPYKIYSGRCTGADPTKFIANYFTTHPMPTLTPGASAGSLVVREPATNFLVQRNNSSGVATNRQDAYIYAYPTGADCNEPIVLGPTLSTGIVANPGLPFGDYQICAEYTTSGSTYHVDMAGTLQNRAENGISTQTKLLVPRTTANGACADPTPPPAE